MNAICKITSHLTKCLFWIFVSFFGFESIAQKTGVVLNKPFDFGLLVNCISGPKGYFYALDKESKLALVKIDSTYEADTLRFFTTIVKIVDLQAWGGNEKVSFHMFLSDVSSDGRIVSVVVKKKDIKFLKSGYTEEKSKGQDLLLLDFFADKIIFKYTFKPEIGNSSSFDGQKFLFSATGDKIEYFSFNLLTRRLVLDSTLSGDVVKKNSKYRLGSDAILGNGKYSKIDSVMDFQRNYSYELRSNFFSIRKKNKLIFSKLVFAKSDFSIHLFSRISIFFMLGVDSIYIFDYESEKVHKLKRGNNFQWLACQLNSGKILSISSQRIFILDYFKGVTFQLKEKFTLRSSNSTLFNLDKSKCSVI